MNGNRCAVTIMYEG